MLIRINRFNPYLAGALISGLVVAAIAGCKTAGGQDKKAISTLRLHLETKPNPMSKTETVEVYRNSPIKFSADPNPFLTEGLVKEAKIVEVTGGFALQIQFDEKGTWLLDEYTGANRGKHILVSSQFYEPGQETLAKGRWLAAPQINRHLTNGVFTFTPDATRDESDRIVLGLNHVAKQLSNGEDVKW
jgi:hypothetical protein